jgi:hypothetical protein
MDFEWRIGARDSNSEVRAIVVPAHRPIGGDGDEATFATDPIEAADRLAGSFAGLNGLEVPDEIHRKDQPRDRLSVS